MQSVLPDWAVPPPQLDYFLQQCCQIGPFFAMLSVFHLAVTLFVSNHFIVFKWYACLHCLLHLELCFKLCSNPLTWFKPFNISLRLHLCGFIKTYFQPHFLLQHSPHFLQEMHFLVNFVLLDHKKESCRVLYDLVYRCVSGLGLHTMYNCRYIPPYSLW